MYQRTSLFFKLFIVSAYTIAGDKMIYVYINSKRMAYVGNMLNAICLHEEKQLQEQDVLILPVINENQRTLPLQKGMLHLDKLHHITIFIPNINRYIQEDNNVYYYMRDEEVAKKNAYLTAAGMLSFLLEREYDYQEIVVDVIGYGKCGKAIYELLKAMKMQVRMIRREAFYPFISMNEYRNMKKGNVIINTSPYNECKKEDFNDTCCIIDISSEKCFSKDWEDEKMNIIYPGSLPNMYAPYSCAKLIADYVKGKCYEE